MRLSTLPLWSTSLLVTMLACQEDPAPPGFDGAEGRGTPRAAQLHLHGSLSEFEGTMACHTQQAEDYDVDLLWWSDHDNMVQMVHRTGGFDFDGGALEAQTENAGLVMVHGLVPTVSEMDEASSELVEGGPSGEGWFWRLGGRSPEPSGDWVSMEYAYVSEIDSVNHLPLLSGLTLGLSVKRYQPIDTQWEFSIQLQLSSACEGEPNRLTYFAGGVDLTEFDTTQDVYLPIDIPEEMEWVELQLPVSADAERFAEGDDQSVTLMSLGLRARQGRVVTFDIDDLSLTWTHQGEALRDQQEAVLAERYSAGNVTHFVGQEITFVTDQQHVNPLGEQQVPFVDYVATGEISQDEAVAHVHAHDAYALCAHPFGVGIGIEWVGEAADEQAVLLAESWMAAEAHGCDAVEVGYRERGGVGLEQHLLFWDLLSSAGYYVTGVGTGDLHHVDDWLDVPNPFLTWVFLDELERGAVAEQVARGRVFFGDLGAFVGRDPMLDLWSEQGAVMGQVLASDLDHVVHVETGYVEAGWELQLVVDGQIAQHVVLDGDEQDTVFTVSREDVTTIRAQLCDGDGTIVLLTNPLYLVETAAAADVPPLRQASSAAR